MLLLKCLQQRGWLPQQGGDIATAACCTPQPERYHDKCPTALRENGRYNLLKLLQVQSTCNLHLLLLLMASCCLVACGGCCCCCCCWC
jgi:hypothetical protein